MTALLFIDLQEKKRVRSPKAKSSYPPASLHSEYSRASRFTVAECYTVFVEWRESMVTVSINGQQCVFATISRQN